MRPGNLRALACLAIAAIALAAATATKGPDFNREIRPILSDHCFSCHGPDEKSRMANLRLDTRDGAFARKADSAYIVPGNSAASLLFQRINHDKKTMRMPPEAFGRPLNPKQIALLRAWIDDGAKWETHWSYTPPERAALPAVKLKSWPRNPIDHFILARLEQEKLKPSPEAGRATLLRRLSLDLTGLPPTPAETAAFLSDRSPSAYEKQVDRLLASPHYGEKMAMHWLDLARYADTHGYHIDSHRDMWPWRDWVIAAFNNNQPFDQFTIEQLAGDLLPNPTREQRLATGFHRNHMINFEGGAIPEEYQTEYVIDRLEATTNVWMGMTMGCARCHDHKYDPISQRDFYRFFAFFNTIPEKGLDGRKGNAEPMLPIAATGQLIEIDQLECAIREHKEAIDEKQIAAAQQLWEKTAQGHLAGPVKENIAAHYPLDGGLTDISGQYRHGRASAGEPSFGNGMVDRSVSLTADDELELGALSLDTARPFSFALWIKPSSDKAEVIPILSLPGIALRTEPSRYQPELKRAARLQIHVARLGLQSREPIIIGDWTHIALSWNGAGKAALFVNGEQAAAEILENSPAPTPHTSTTLLISGYRGALDDIRFYSRAITAQEAHTLAVHMPAAALLDVPAAKRDRDQKARLRQYFLTRAAPDAMRKQHAELAALEKRKEEMERAIPTAMVMQEMDKPRETFILARGDYRNKTEKVTAAVPAALPPLPAGVPANRLSLARWIVDPANPLTSRVAVNRYWQAYFGTGLVKTAEDFGSQGETPSHRALLDWLATEFSATGWDVKAMQRLLVTSATYRQSSKVTPGFHARDPENRLLSHMSRFRLPAELVRDNALAASGLIQTAIGGPSVFPYQPAGLWEEMAFHGIYSAQAYTPSTGPDLYRRSMYTFWKRTVPPAALSTFDAPDREKCTARRAITNTPLQALVLMNDPTYVEASRKLAERAITEAPASKRIAWLFRQVTLRDPSPKEAAALLSLARGQTAHYTAQPEAARELLTVGQSPYNRKLNTSELAAWTNIASVVLSLDETITKE